MALGLVQQRALCQPWDGWWVEEGVLMIKLYKANCVIASCTQLTMWKSVWPVLALEGSSVHLLQVGLPLLHSAACGWSGSPVSITVLRPELAVLPLFMQLSARKILPWILSSENSSPVLAMPSLPCSAEWQKTRKLYQYIGQFIYKP